jgi:hypothetical protein
VRSLSILLFLAACSKGSIDVDTDTSSETDTIDIDTDVVDTGPAFDETACFSDSFWTRGDHGSSSMHPGRDCIDCHRREGPTFKAAGTVFTGLHEPDDCNGLSHVTVELTDNNGDVHTTKTNSAGNFYFDRTVSLPAPYSARVFDDAGLESEMVAHQTVGACNSCHTVDGKNDAPGRIRLR